MKKLIVGGGGVCGGGGGGVVFFFKQKTAYEMCGRDWSSDVCSSDLYKYHSSVSAMSCDLPPIVTLYTCFQR